MELLNIDFMGIELFCGENKEGAGISSEMFKEDKPENKLFNAAVDGLECMILSHFTAGIDVASAAYIQGIKEAYNAIFMNADDLGGGVLQSDF